MASADREPPLPSDSEKAKIYIDSKTGREIQTEFLRIVEEDGSEDLLFPAKGNVLIEVYEAEITEENKSQVYKTPDGRWFMQIAESRVDKVEKAEEATRREPNPEQEKNERDLKTLEKAFELMAPDMNAAEYAELAQFFSLEENYGSATVFAEKVEAAVASLEAAKTDEERLRAHQDFRKDVMIPMINLMRGIETEEGEEGSEDGPEGDNESNIAAIKSALEQMVPDMSSEQQEELFNFLRQEENHDEAAELAQQLLTPMEDLKNAIDANDQVEEKRIRAEIREKILIPFINKIVKIDSPEKLRQEAEARRRMEQMISALEIQKQQLIKEHDAYYQQSIGKKINPREFHVLALDGERVMARMGMAIAEVHLKQAKLKKEYREKYGEDWPKPPEFVQHLLEKSQNLPPGTFDPGKPGMMELLNSLPREKQLEMLAQMKKEYEKKKEIEKRRANLDKNTRNPGDGSEGGDKTFTRELIGAQQKVEDVARELMGARLRASGSTLMRGPLLRMFNNKDKGRRSRFDDAIIDLTKAYASLGRSLTESSLLYHILTAARDTANLKDDIPTPPEFISQLANDAAREIGNTRNIRKLVRELPNALKRLGKNQKKNSASSRLLNAMRVQAEILRSHY